MYCRYCGQEIEDNSKACKHCGKILVEKEVKKVHQDSVGKSVVISLLIIAVIFIVVFSAIKIATNDDSSGNIFERLIARDIKQTDYSITTQRDTSYFSVTIRPNTDFYTCSVECEVFNSRGELIYSNTIKKEDLEAYSTYTYTFDYGFSAPGTSVNYKITGKCQS